MCPIWAHLLRANLHTKNSSNLSPSVWRQLVQYLLLSWELANHNHILPATDLHIIVCLNTDLLQKFCGKLGAEAAVKLLNHM